MIDQNMTLNRLSALYERCRRIERDRQPKEGAALRIMATPFADYMPRTRLEAVTDDLSGTRYAVWVIGETLAAIGGYDLMHSVFTSFERQHDARAAAWLDHRWSGVGDGIWTA